MLLVYMTLTGNVRHFVDRTEFDAIELDASNTNMEVYDDFILVIPSYVGLINKEVEQFLSNKNNLKHLIGFASSGNINFNDLFCVNAKELSERFDKPILFTFEYSGTDKDVEDFKKEVRKIEVARTESK